MSISVLVPLDGTSLAESAIPAAVSIAKQSHGRLELVIVHELRPYDGFRDAPWNSMSESMQHRYVADRAAALSTPSTGTVGHAMLHGDPAEEIVRRAHAAGAGLIVMTTRARTGLTRVVGGSVADEVVRKAGMPVLVIRVPEDGASHPTPAAFRTVLVLSDGSSQSHRIFESVRVLCTPETTAILLHIVQPIRPIPDPSLPFGYLPSAVDQSTTGVRVAEERAALMRLAEELRERSGCSVEAHIVVSDDVVTAIASFAAEHGVDLIAMTTHGRGASRLLFGSVSEGVGHATSTPMLVLNPAVAAAAPGVLWSPHARGESAAFVDQAPKEGR